MAERPTVLVVEDEAHIRELVTLHLRLEGLTPLEAADGESGLTQARTQSFDLIILDLMLPGLDGVTVCRAIRRDSPNAHTPILMLTAKSSELDRVLGLELGADDYLTKPFSMLELAARVKAVFRRADHQQAAAERVQQAEQPIEAGSLRIDLQRHEALLDGRLLDLTAKEFELLAYFARSPGRVHTRAQLLDQVWGYSHSGYEHTVNSHINRLRNKIERDPANPDFIQTVWGVGYKFADRRP